MKKRLAISVSSALFMIALASPSFAADPLSTSGSALPILTEGGKAFFWTEMTPSPTATGRSAIGWIGDYVYLFGNETYPNVALYWHVPTEAWGNSTPYPGQGDNWTGAVLGGELYVLGRFDLSSPTNEFRKFTPDGAGGGTWTQLANYPMAISMLAAAADTMNGLIYAAGGYNGSTGVPNAYVYDVAGNTWSPIASLPQARLCVGGAFLNGKFYVVAGLETSGFTYTNTLYEYDPDSLAWFSRANIPQGVAFNWSSVTTDGNYIYQVGGGGGYASWPALNAVQVYDAQGDSWFLETSLPAANGTNSAVWVGAPALYFLSTGGWDGAQYIGQTFKGMPPFDHDVGVESLDSPPSGVAPNVPLTPQATVKNYGLNTESFPVTLTIDSATVPVYTDTQQINSLLPDSTVQVNFLDWTPNGPGNAYTVCVYTLLPGDEYPVNDTVCQPTMTYSYYEDFEASNGGYAPDPPTGGWEWGVPTSGPGGAHSGLNLWATILAGDYLDNANWKLDSRDFVATLDNPALEFWHWYEMESYWDGGNVKISTDWGGTWQIVTPVGGYPEDAISPANAGIPGEPAYSASSGGWQLGRFNLTGMAAGTFFRLRWHFGSDGSIVYPGWYVDDVYGFGFEPVVFGAIHGTITDYNTGDSLQGAVVTSLTTGHSDTTDLNGYYYMVAPPTSHDLRGVAPAYNYKDTTGIVVLSAETTTVDLALRHYGAIHGTVTDLATGDSILGAIVTSVTAGVGDTTDLNGYYFIEVPDASHDMHVEAPGYSSLDTSGVIVTGPDTTTADFALGHAEISVSPTSFRVGLLPNHYLITCLWIYNYGNGRLDFDIEVDVTSLSRRDGNGLSPQMSRAPYGNQTGLSSFSRTPPGWEPPVSLYPGEIIEQHPSIGDPTGFEFDETNRCFWQGAWDNYIYELDTNFVQIGQHLEFGSTGMPPTGLAWHRGYLYQANYDEGRVYKINVSNWTAVDTIYSPGGANLLGVEWIGDRLWLSDDDQFLYECDSLGNQINQYVTDDLVPFGLAYLPALDTLYLCGWSGGNIYSVDPHTGNQYIAFPTPGSGGSWSCSGASYDNRYPVYLWIAHQTDRQLYLTDTGNEAWLWLDANPRSGSLAPGDTFHVSVIFNSTGLQPGLYTGELRINNNSITTPIVVPCTLDVYLVGLEEASLLRFPRAYSLSQNAPNPTSSSTAVKYQLPVKSEVSLRVYNASGQVIRSLVDGPLGPGYYAAIWDGRDSSGRRVSSGVYFLRLSASPQAGSAAEQGISRFEASKKMVVLK